MSEDYSRYTYRVIVTPRETVVREKQTINVAIGRALNTPLDVEGASYHRLFDEADPGAPVPVGLIECEDGSVITYEDLIGRWDPEDAPLDEVLRDTTERSHATESDYFKRQLEEIDTSVYKAKYPTGRGEILLAPGWLPERAPDPSLWRRFVYRVWRLRRWIGLAIAGYDPRED